MLSIISTKLVCLIFQDLSSSSSLTDGNGGRPYEQPAAAPIPATSSARYKPDSSLLSSKSFTCTGAPGSPPIPPPTRRSPVPHKRVLRHQSSLSEDSNQSVSTASATTATKSHSIKSGKFKNFLSLFPWWQLNGFPPVNLCEFITLLLCRSALFNTTFVCALYDFRFDNFHNSLRMCCSQRNSSVNEREREREKSSLIFSISTFCKCEIALTFSIYLSQTVLVNCSLLALSSQGWLYPWDNFYGKLLDLRGSMARYLGLSDFHLGVFFSGLRSFFFSAQKGSRCTVSRQCVALTFEVERIWSTPTPRSGVFTNACLLLYPCFRNRYQ